MRWLLVVAIAGGSASGITSEAFGDKRGCESAGLKIVEFIGTTEMANRISFECIEDFKKREAKKKRILSWLTKASYFSIAVYFSICAIGWYS